MKLTNKYLRGIGVGLIISWVTGALAYLKVGSSTFPEVIELELVLSVIFLIVSFLIKDK
jgi:predicted branched-subunit amino acid permease